MQSAYFRRVKITCNAAAGAAAREDSMLTYHTVAGHREIIEDGKVVARISEDASVEQVRRLRDALYLLRQYEVKTGNVK